MKQILFYVGLMLTLGFTACAHNNSQKKEIDNQNQQKKEKKMETIHLTKAEFLQKVADIDKDKTTWKYLGDKPCIIDFYASWCGPCKALSPILEELAKEYGGKIYIYKIDTDQEQELAGAFGIRSIPTLIFCPMQGNPQMTLGALPKDSLSKLINEVLLKKGSH